MATPVHVILNPRAGDGQGRKVRPELERELSRRGFEPRIRETEDPGHATRIARDLAERGAALIVAAGGDGTVHEVVNGILAAEPTDGPTDRPGVYGDSVLGVIPIGTGNDFVKVVTGATDRRRAYDALVDGSVRRYDVGLATWDGGREYFVNGIGTGIDVEVVRQMLRYPRLHGVVSYLVALLRALVRFEPIALRLRADAEASNRRVMIVAVANGPCIGGGFYVCPDAEPDDGRMDVCIVDELKWMEIARVLPRVLRGTHGGMRKVSLSNAQAVEITVDGAAPLYFQLDGELREPERARTLRIEVVPGGLPVLTRAGDPSVWRRRRGRRAVAPVPASSRVGDVPVPATGRGRS